MKIEEQTFTQLLLTSDEWGTVQQGLELLVEQQRNPIAARMLDIELPEQSTSAADTPTPRRRGRPPKQGPKIEPTPEMIAEAERMKAIRTQGAQELAGVTLEP